MANNYKIGYYYERKVKSILEKQGYTTWRTPGSHSPIDIIALSRDGKIKLIQVKRNRKKIKLHNINYMDLYQLYNLVKYYEKSQNIDIEVWIFNENNLDIYNKNDILNIKNAISLQS
ncbi:hypothetical protein MJ1_0227 [Nanobdella aerobiophila]|uniref:Holliday junction resolvase n=1 Tax=Nanobdella aerobiophila TaxID=2586965 RepID=A0A915SK30_9ARCH|nr:restriction endonuclease [Nanobdella aerobiophila]BBL45398.1 hypothetical protein MJ1_0227 [Nanobdella aerobiophila]